MKPIVTLAMLLVFTFASGLPAQAKELPGRVHGANAGMTPPAAQEPEEKRPEPTGDKKLDKYNSMNYTLRLMHKEKDRKEKAGHYNVVAGIRELFIERGDIEKTDPGFDKITAELQAAYKELEPYKEDFPMLIPALSYEEVIAAKEEAEAAKYEEMHGDHFMLGNNYSGADAAQLKAIALKNFHAGASKGSTIVHSNFKHGWVIDKERSGQNVVAHIKRLRYLIIYKKSDGNYYRAEALFSERAPIAGSYTRQAWGEIGYFSNPIPEKFIEKKLVELKK